MLMASCEMLDASTESGVMSRECLATSVELPSITVAESVTEITTELSDTELELEAEFSNVLDVTVDCEMELDTD